MKVTTATEQFMGIEMERVSLLNIHNKRFVAWEVDGHLGTKRELKQAIKRAMKLNHNDTAAAIRGLSL